MQQGDTIQKDIRQQAEEYIHAEIKKIDLLNNQMFSVKRELEKAILLTVFVWLKTGHINSISDAIRAADEFIIIADRMWAASLERGDDPAWQEEYKRKEELLRWMSDGLMDAIRKEESVGFIL